MKEPVDYLQINLLGMHEQNLRVSRIVEAMRQKGIPSALVHNNANLYYLTGRVFRGYVYISAESGRVLYFVRQPSTLRSDEPGVLFHIRKPEEIAGHLAKAGIDVPAEVGIELDSLSFGDACRLAKSFGMDSPKANVSPIIRSARSVKTDAELEMIIRSGQKHSYVYERIPRLYQEGMTDIDLQIAIEALSRREGCLGIFRIAGDAMEIFMGNVLTGHNSDEPSPYDFAMGGRGLNPSLPVGADGTLIKPGIPVMVDVNGNFTGYMTDMTRMFYIDKLDDEASRACRLSAEICDTLAAMMLPGAKACDLYAKARSMAEEAGLGDNFMGHRSQAGFVGHGVGIEINELPVIAPRSRDILEVGNVIALEPKFVIPNIGAAGIENTYIVTATGGRKITTAPEQPVRMD